MAKLLTWQIGMISQFCKSRLFFLIERIVWAHYILFYLLYHSFRNVYRFFFVLYRVLQTHSVQKEEKKMENLGIDSITSRMQSGRSTIWANSPARKIQVISWMIWEFSLCQHTFCLLWGPYWRVDAFIFSEFASVVILCLCCSGQVKYPR